MPSRRAMLVGLTGLALGGCGTPDAVPLDLELPGLPGLTTNGGWNVPGFGAGEFARSISVLNVWASWCPVCRGEHGHLRRLAGDGRFRLLGLVYNDAPEKAAAYLRRAGNPYAAVAADDGRLSGAVRQRGVPGSYVIGRNGRVLARAAGGVDGASFAALLLPAILRARAGDEVTVG